MRYFPFILSVLLLVSCTKTKYKYETVENDPLGAMVYTLDNGLKIYMTVNKEQPRIQTLIAVHAGGKDDPAESTGLAHYLEHLMFKGTTHFGTWNYEAESVELAKIDSLYEVYNHTTDATLRRAIYHQIDSVSYEASRYAIANEYDKLMATIGSDGTNAFTTEDMTVYTEDIPSNQLDNWARVQGDRFQNMVIRLFHTELEAVYEEKNIAMSSDQDKVFECLANALYPHHPYGQQTVIGTQEHLKNPSIVNIRRYFQNFYRPNNVAICMSGDFNPDEVVDVVKKYFGEWEPNENITRREKQEEKPITNPIVREVVGEEAEAVWMAWRTPASNSKDQVVLELISSMLNNGQAGLFDLNLNQTQRVLTSGCFNYQMEDKGQFICMAIPMPGQTLDEARELMLREVLRISKGNFDDELLQSVITEAKLSRQKSLEENEDRAMQLMESFIYENSWADAVEKQNCLASVTKDDVVRVAKQYLGAKNMVVVNKLQGVDATVQKIEKPEINPVMTNRDSVSTFLSEVQKALPAPIEPVFLDFQRDLSFSETASGMQVVCKENTINELFSLSYVYPTGNDADRTLEMAATYFDYLGTDDMSAEEVKKAFYRLGCEMSFKVGRRRTLVTISGLEENRNDAVQLAEKVLTHLRPDVEALEKLKQTTLQSREVSLTDQDQCNAYLRTYATCGAEYVKAHTLSNEEVMALDAQQLVDYLKAFSHYRHTITYYGPSATHDVVAMLDQCHHVESPVKDVPALVDWNTLATPANCVFLGHYNAPNAIMLRYTNICSHFDAELEPIIALYNEYFGGGMNTIVFQEIRESRGLAYNAWARFISPSYTHETHGFIAQAKTQVDKVEDCQAAFSEIIENMPRSAHAFDISREALLTRLRTQRITRDAVIWSYFDALDLGIDYDINQRIFERVQNMTLDDLTEFQKKYVKGRTYTYSIIADRSRIDMDLLESLGQVQRVDIASAAGFVE